MSRVNYIQATQTQQVGAGRSPRTAKVTLRRSLTLPQHGLASVMRTLLGSYGHALPGLWMMCCRCAEQEMENVSLRPGPGAVQDRSVLAPVIPAGVEPSPRKASWTWGAVRMWV